MSRVTVSDDPLHYYWKALEELKPLPLEEELELAKRAKKGDMKAKEKVILSNLRYVVDVALREGWNSGVPLEDLISEGNLGLLKAFEKYDPERGVRLISYADKWIREAILKFIRSYKPLSGMPHISNKDLQKITELYQELGREPTVEEIAKKLGTSKLRVKRILNAIRTRFYSTENRSGDREDRSDTFSSLVATDGQTVEREYTRTRVHDLFEKVFKSDVLNEKEKIVLSEFLGLDGKPKSLAEIGRKWGVSREYIRQLKASALKKIRKAFPEFSHLVEEYSD
ncbi:MAG: sigma-70 family RNA polymerase sigma factor [Thermotogae bacterium]|nr:sigma-70 family RNA polymerase sigma factor [Thermotogota bacterium]